MPTILVVDDNPVDRRLVGGILKKAPDLEIEYAENGALAIEHMRQHTPSLVVTDLIMPEMDGLELVAAIVAEFPFVPVILMTGKGSEEIAVKALQAGASSYVPKNTLADELVDTVENVLAMSNEERTHARLMDCLSTSACSFALDNDPSMIPALVNYIQRSVRGIGLCDESNSIRVCVALEEALNNALFHGNLDLSSDVREGDRQKYKELVEFRRRNPPWSDRRVTIDVTMSRQEGRFVIRDEGRGFDPSTLPDPLDPSNLDKISGRGLLLMKTFMDHVEFNAVGNGVTMVKRRPNV